MPPVVPNQSQRQVGILAAPANRARALAQQAGPPIIVPNPQVTAYTFSPFDIGKCVESTSGSPITFTIPANATNPMPLNSIFEVFAQGTGKVTVVGAGGVTIDGADPVSGAVTLKQNQTARFRQRLTDEWVVSGLSGTALTAMISHDISADPGAPCQWSSGDIVYDDIGIVVDPSSLGDPAVVLPAGIYDLSLNLWFTTTSFSNWDPTGVLMVSVTEGLLVVSSIYPADGFLHANSANQPSSYFGAGGANSPIFAGIEVGATAKSGAVITAGIVLGVIALTQSFQVPNTASGIAPNALFPTGTKLQLNIAKLS